MSSAHYEEYINSKEATLLPTCFQCLARRFPNLFIVSSILHKMSGDGDQSERQLIEDYLKLYCIEDIFDEIVNSIIETRPSNPYMEISKLIESKSMPEIIEVTLSPILVPGGANGIEAIMCTNLGKFSARCSFPTESTQTSILFRDFSIVQERVTDSLRKLDPTNIFLIDESLGKILADEPTVLLAVSIACCRAGARHKGLSVHKFISDLSGCEPFMPIPVPAMLGRGSGGPGKTLCQNVYLTPTNSNDLQSSVEILLQASRRALAAVEASGLAYSLQSNGFLRVSQEGVDKVAKVICNPY